MWMWTKENLCLLIRLYEHHKCLWQTTSSLYRAEKKEAVESITSTLRTIMPNIKYEDVRNKIDRIRFRFNFEINKLHSYRCQGETYEPKLWYFKRLSFLEPYTKIKQMTTKNQEQSTTTSPNQTENISSSVSQNNGEELENVVVKNEGSDVEIIEDSENEPCPKPKIENQHTSVSENNINSSTEVEKDRILDSLPTITLVPTEELIEKKTEDAPKLDSYENNVTEEKKHEVVELSDDKISIFGQFIMCQLRSVTDKVLYMKLEHRIQTAIIETQIKQIEIDQLNNQ